ncbi:MAG: SRPBCC domain-containing protein [Hyphomonadaceae bacterium]|nr:SRPBCC domain-containing protein [Hyphomonadaceae bacterium]
MSSSVIVALRIKAAPQRVFDVFTREIAAWWKPNDLFQFTPRSPGVLAFEAGVGGRFTETLANGKVFEIGRITAWAPGEHLAFTWRQASFAPDQETHVDVRFERIGAETRVTVEHRGWDSVPREHVAKHGFPNEIFLQRHGEWWRALLALLRSAS